MLAQAPFLLALIAKELRQGEPFERLFVPPLTGGDHARQRGRHFRAKRNLPLAFIGEMVELADDFLAALSGEEFQWFQWGTIVFVETVAPRQAAPSIENILACIRTPQAGLRQWFGIKIAKTRQSFHSSPGA